MYFARSTRLVAVALCAAFGAASSLAQTAPDASPSLADITEAWLDSPHGDRSSESFTHWDDDGGIPGTCAVCHSSTGAIEYLRGPMLDPGVIGHSVSVGTTVDCAACHNSAAAALVSVPVQGGAKIETLEPASAICTVCHQGRATTASVVAATSGLEDDIVAGDLGFINVHYVPSAATLMGTAVQAGFEYPGRAYVGQFAHVPDLNSCTECHDPHSLDVDLADCTTCHINANSFAAIRISPLDFDGDGDTAEGVSDEISELHARLGRAIQSYAADVSDAPVVYAAGAYPYFFADSDADGVASDAEAVFPNRYKSWTPRLLKAAYNYQLVAKEPAIFAHNPHYALQLLFDSLEDLSVRVPVDLNGLSRP